MLFTSLDSSLNLYAYCLNNPINRSDRSGEASSSSADINHNSIPDYLEERWVELTNRYKAILSGQKCRDVTADINSALQTAVKEGSAFAIKHPFLKLKQFYELVNHEAPWNIKRKDPWEKTIGSEYPGSYNTVVLYDGHYYTPEILGNYTYGVLGKAYGINLDTLTGGSFFAAGFPTYGTTAFDNEVTDWLFISNGYYRGY